MFLIVDPFRLELVVAIWIKNYLIKMLHASVVGEMEELGICIGNSLLQDVHLVVSLPQ